jgi:hypothetical protein
VHWQFTREDIPIMAHFGDATPRYQNKRIKCIFIAQRQRVGAASPPGAGRVLHGKCVTGIVALIGDWGLP